ncbi:hypothetical protein RHECNPAF_850017 [Rhizobium etli CNPAF512]|nr:hypothetical protein RHECNPAF_850017 [Rhizobium etli CNPAF512]
MPRHGFPPWQARQPKRLHFLCRFVRSRSCSFSQKNRCQPYPRAAIDDNSI